MAKLKIAREIELDDGVYSGRQVMGFRAIAGDVTMLDVVIADLERMPP